MSCKIKLRSAEEWAAAGATEKNCPPCLMSPLAGNYITVLEEAGLKAEADELKTAWNQKDVVVVARALDTIKKKVSPQIKSQLEDLDCFAQTYEET